MLLSNVHYRSAEEVENLLETERFDYVLEK
jgi:hypothetical protein